MSTTQEAGFAILESNTILRTDRNPGNTERKLRTYGATARLANGRMVARSVSHDVAGSVMLNYGAYDPNVPQTFMTPSEWRPDTFYAAKLAEVDRDPGVHEVKPLPVDPLITKFVQEYPPVAEFIGLTTTEELRGLFQTGKFVVPKWCIDRLDSKPARDGLDGWRHLNGLHRSGNHGFFGTHDAANQLSYEEWFMLGTLPIAKQNAAAIASQHGAVRSSYEVKLLGSTRIASVLTILAGHATRTLGFLGEF
jgi:hypothetical protein